MYEEMGIYQLLFSIRDNNILERIVEEQVGILIAYDQENDSEFLTTLDVYLQENCNITKTTERLYVHRNTVKYRIKRIQELLKKDIHDVNGSSISSRIFCCSSTSPARSRRQAF